MNYYLIYRSIHLNGTQDRALIPAMSVKVFTELSEVEAFVERNKKYFFSYSLVYGEQIGGQDVR